MTEARRVELFGGFLDSLAAPTPAQLWLERAAEQLRTERDPTGDRKAKRDKLVIEVMERDGADCWFCGHSLNGDVTLEHLRPLALGGDWQLSNLALAHRGCNQRAGRLPRADKERLRDELRAQHDSRAGNQEAHRKTCPATISGAAK